jgi:hypothetical protein
MLEKSGTSGTNRLPSILLTRDNSENKPGQELDSIR